jgi:hypothetical protein
VVADIELGLADIRFADSRDVLYEGAGHQYEIIVFQFPT